MDLSFTLAQVSACSPCEDGWRKALKAFGTSDPATVISIGDMVLSNGIEDALWCLRVLNWEDVAVRRYVLRTVVLPACRRAATHTTDSRVIECLDALDRWVDGDDTVDLAKLAAGAEAAQAEEWAAARAARAETARALEAAGAEAALEAAEAAWAAAWAAEAAAEEEKRQAQLRDILAAFPPIKLGGA